MKRKTPVPARRLPIDFGDEPLCSVIIQKESGRPRRSAVKAECKPGTNLLAQRIYEPPGFSAQLFNRKAKIKNRKSTRGFTLVEILVVLVLLSLIVFALMAVFNGAQRAFRASLTQTDILEGGRAVMDLITADLQTMTPCNMESNVSNPNLAWLAPENFYAFPKTFINFGGPPSPLYQSLISSPSGALRTNVLEDIFILSKGNINGTPSWIATGYSVNTNLVDGTLYPLYRFYMTTNLSSGYSGLTNLFGNFVQLNYTNGARWSHLLDGVINLTARTYDTNGIWMTNGYANPGIMHVRFANIQPALNFKTVEPWSAFYSNAVPASVQIDMATMEDRTLAHAEGLSGIKQSNYLANAAGHVHLFRQRVWIRNLDRTAYQ